jgi:hypothetical protein
MAEPSATNPYPGPRPFVAGESLYGRDREVTKLFYLLSAERIVVLHSPSGAGKSSLLNAGLVPMLREERFYPWPTIRLSQPAADGGNRFVRSAIASLEEGLPESLRRPAEELAGASLAEYVAGRPRRPGAPASVVLVFDQFEEILTLDPLALDARREFFRQLGEALENPDVWALFALREDYLGALDPFRDEVPTRLSNTFRVDLLTVDDARDAIAKPAHDAGREFAPDAAEKLAKDLATISVQQPDGSFEEETGVYVEPLQLQVVCRRLWDELPPDARTIGVENLQASGDVNSALAAYYDVCVGAVAGEDVGRERAIREWFGDRLITPGGIRGQVLREHGTSGALDNESVDRLVSTHLVRAEERDGKTWFELAHDRLVAPVRASNAEWSEGHLHPMQRQAALWEREGRSDGLLLRGEALKEAERWARENPTSLLPVEEKLVATSSRRQREGRSKRLTLVVAGVVSIIAVVAAVFSVALLSQRDKALGSARESSELKAAAEQTATIVSRAVKAQAEAQTAQSTLNGFEQYVSNPDYTAKGARRDFAKLCPNFTIDRCRARLANHLSSSIEQAEVRLAAAAAASAGGATIPPDSVRRTDLFDYAQGARVSRTSGDNGAAMFGAGTQGLPASAGMNSDFVNSMPLVTFFADEKPVLYEHWVEWKTRGGVDLQSIGLFAKHDDVEDGYKYRRAFSEFELYAREGGKWVQLIRYTPTLPYGGGENRTSLAVCLPVPPTSASEFKAVFVQAEDVLGQFSGPRVVGLDGNALDCSHQYPKG